MDISDYCERYFIYTSKQDIYDEEEYSLLFSAIREDFKYGNDHLSLEKLRKISDILQIGGTDDNSISGT